MWMGILFVILLIAFSIRHYEVTEENKALHLLMTYKCFGAEVPASSLVDRSSAFQRVVSQYRKM